jgi:predicted aspartyl protease
VPALVDTGADVTLLPRWCAEQLGLTPHADATVMIAWFDGTLRAAESVELEATFHGGRFQGRFALID